MSNLSNVGKYEVQGLVGEGAMGVVYRALDPMLNRVVAVKVMNEALALDESFRTRFLREARAAGSMQHPNVITVYDCGETDGHLYIAMEYVAGTDLEQLIASKVPITVTDKIDIVIGVLNGLAYAHKRGIVHRDMKPANIRVNEDGRALIMDFGIAYTSSSNVTRTGLILGTPNYMAPEQVTGGAITAQTDIFSVGVVLYELLTNVRPFEGGTLHSVLFKIVSESPVAPDKIVDGLRADLAAIVMKALAKEPEQRFATALDMANALSTVSTAITSGGAPGGSRTLSLRKSIESAIHKEQEEKGERDRRRVWQRAGAAVAAAVIIVVVAATVLIQRGGATARPRAAPVDESVRQAAAISAPRDSHVAAPAVIAAASAPVAPTPRTVPRTDATPTGADMSLPQSLQASARQSRRRAVDAGAGGPQLALGDQHFVAGDQAIRKKHRDDAMREFSQASSAFGDAESAARTRMSSAAAPATTFREQKAPAVAAIAPLQVPSAPSVPAINPSAEIAGVVSQYAKAIESRDIAEMKRLYPGMSPAQASSFEDFFRSVSNLRVAFSVSNTQVDGPSADTRLSGSYDFVASNGRAEHQPLALQAVLRKDGGAWRFVSIK